MPYLAQSVIVLWIYFLDALLRIWMAYLNMIRPGFGSGMLSFALAISQAGIILGPILSILTGLLIIHTHKMLMNCLNEVGIRLRIPYISFRYGFRLCLLHGPPFFHCLGRCGPTLIAIFMLMSQIGICTVFVNFTSDSLRDIMDWEHSRTAMFCLFLPYMILEILMKNLSIVSYTSLIGNCMNLTGLILIIYIIFEDPRKDYVLRYATIEPLPLLFTFSTFLFNLTAVGVILTIDKALVNPDVMVSRFGVINVGMMVPNIVATIFGILGYWSFGPLDENVLRALPHDENVAIISMALYMVSIALVYPIQCHPAIAIIIEVCHSYSTVYEPSQEFLKVLEFIARPVFVILTFTIAYLAPYQAPFVAFVGSLCTSMLALVFPALMEMSLMYPNSYGRHNIYLYKNILIVLLGLVTWIFGGILSGQLMYVRIKSNRSPNDPDVYR